MNTAGSGDWSAGATWVGGVPPTAADTAVILNTHAVTLDNTSCVALSVTVNSGGTLTCATGASSTLTVQQGITANSGSTVNLDTSGNVAVICTIILNNAATTVANAGLFRLLETVTATIKGFPRKRIATLLTAVTTSGVASTSATVSDATGWQVGDKIIFSTTGAYNATTATDEITIATVNNGTGAITWTGSCTNAHSIGGYAGNFSSNMVIKPPAAGGVSRVNWDRGYGSTFNAKTISNVLFDGLKSNVYNAHGSFQVSGFTVGSRVVNVNLSVLDCAFYDFRTSGLVIESLRSPMTVNRNVFYSANVSGTAYAPGGAVAFYPGGNSYDAGSWSELGIFRVTGSAADDKKQGFAFASSDAAGLVLSNSFVSGTSLGVNCAAPNIELIDVESFSNLLGAQYGTGAASFTRFNNGYIGSASASNSSAETCSGVAVTNINGGLTQTTTVTGLSALSYVSSVSIGNKKNDVTQQEIYRPFMSVKRENTIKNRSTSSIAIHPTKVSTDCQRTLSIPCANGSSIRVIGYVQRQTSATQVATVALSGLGSAWGGFTAANNTTWQVWDTGTITNSSGADGNYTLTYTASDTSSTSGVVYFDGVPDSPFVTKARHYGFTFDEANPVRTVNPVSLVSEATAIAYTGVTATGSQITVGAGTTDTWAKLYAYMQAYACANLTSTVYLTSTDGLTFSLPLTYKLSWPGMGADGTLAGGWLLLAATGTHTYKLSGTKIEFQTAGSYSMGASTFSGTVELVNTSGGAVTVFLPSGTSYTNTGPSITVSTPIIQQSVTLTGVVAGSRVQIYDTTNSIELFNGTSGYSWADSVAAVAPRDIRVRIAYQSGTTAYNFVEANIGTCGTTSPSNAVTYLASQTLDTVYNANGLDGSAVTGITISDGIDRMVINIGGGSVSWPQIYAYNVYWLTTSAGIVDDGSIITAVDNANYRVTLFKIRNSSATPLNITGGYGTDSSTGTVAPLIDTAGSTGNIYQTPDHVVAYQTSGSYAITGDIATVLTAVGNVPTGVRTELTTELARIDVATSTRLSTAGYTAPTTPPTAAAISAQVLADASATPIAADTKAINGVTLQGAGTTLDPMRPV